MRALHLSLRRVKVSIVLLSGVSIALISSASFARPAHAEGLLPTVNCLVQTLLFSGCPQPVQPSSPVVSSPTQSSGQPQSSAPQSNSTASSQTSSVRPLPQQSGAVQSEAPVEALPTPQELTAMAQTPAKATQNPRSYDYVAFFNNSSPYSEPQVQGDANAFLQPSQEGWKMAGLAWYWWIALLATITGVISFIRRWYVRHSTVLSNPR